MPSAAFTRIATTGRTAALYLRGDFLRVIGAAAAPPEALPPVLANVLPAPGTALEKSQPVSVDLTDPQGALVRAILHASFAGAGGVVEVVHDGEAFTPAYAGGSTRIEIPGGFRYTLQRTGGWPGRPTVRPFAFNAAGLELS